MNDTSNGPETKPRASGGIGFGVFLVVVGVLMLAQQMGWLPAKMDWLFPVILIAWGGSEIYKRMR